jgi:transcriptional regulator with XRE-family HTH domain
MLIGERLRQLREAKRLSQSDVEKRTGLLSCYLSRLENGHTVPALETLEKLARALEVRLYQLFYDGDRPPSVPRALRKRAGSTAWAPIRKEAKYLLRMKRYLTAATEAERKLILRLAERIARGSRSSR